MVGRRAVLRPGLLHQTNRRYGPAWHWAGAADRRSASVLWCRRAHRLYWALVDAVAGVSLWAKLLCNCAGNLGAARSGDRAAVHCACVGTAPWRMVVGGVVRQICGAADAI